MVKIINLTNSEREALLNDFSEFDKNLLVEAFKYWTRFGKSTFPIRDTAKFYEYYGDDMGDKLSSYFYLFATDYYAYDGDSELPLDRLGHLASADFRNNHPDVPEEYVEILEWLYVHDRMVHW